MTGNLIYHQDSRDADDILHEAGPWHAMVTDPPYGVAYRSRHATTPTGLKYVKDVENDHSLADAISLFDEVADVFMPYAADEAELYLFTRWDIVDAWMDTVRRLDRHGFKYKMMLIWDKMEPGTGDIDSNWGCGHEIVLYAKKGLRRMPYRRSGVLHFEKVHASKMIHPTEKPVPLLEKLIEMSTNEGDLVVDPFSGSGSTAVASANLWRNSIGWELDPDHVAASRNRLEASDTLVF